MGSQTNSFTKDIEHVKNKLRIRRINFSKNIKVTAPSDAFEKLITIDTIEGDEDELGTPAVWTRLIVKDRITKQE